MFHLYTLRAAFFNVSQVTRALGDLVDIAGTFCKRDETESQEGPLIWADLQLTGAFHAGNGNGGCWDYH